MSDDDERDRTAERAALGHPTWRDPDGRPVSCIEKIKVLNDNFAELRRLAQDAFEDAILMGCDEAQFRAALSELVESLENPYRGRR